MVSQSPWKNPSHLDQFLRVYGVRKNRHLHFVAMHFKRAIIVYKHTHLDEPIQLPPQKVIVFRGPCPSSLESMACSQSHLVFTDDLSVGAVHVPNVGLATLLRACFPKHSILFQTFKNDVLFLIARDNPLEPIMQKCRKNIVFKTLCSLTDARLNRRPLTLEEVSLLRLFKRFDENNLRHFNRWTPFAFDLAHDACIEATLAMPSAFLGRELFGILKRSDSEATSPLPPADFYHCEIMLADEEFVGLAYRLSDRRDHYVDYVSPMVVSRPSAPFLDNGSQLCNAWLPFYRDRATWAKWGLPFYAKGLQYKKMQLRYAANWLELQTAEKYRFMRLDVLRLAHIVLGEERKAEDP